MARVGVVTCNSFSFNFSVCVCVCVCVFTSGVSGVGVLKEVGRGRESEGVGSDSGWSLGGAWEYGAGEGGLGGVYHFMISDFPLNAAPCLAAWRDQRD